MAHIKSIHFYIHWRHYARISFIASFHSLFIFLPCFHCASLIAQRSSELLRRWHFSPLDPFQYFSDSFLPSFLPFIYSFSFARQYDTFVSTGAHRECSEWFIFHSFTLSMSWLWDSNIRCTVDAHNTTLISLSINNIHTPNLISFSSTFHPQWDGCYWPCTSNFISFSFLIPTNTMWCQLKLFQTIAYN